MVFWLRGVHRVNGIKVKRMGKNRWAAILIIFKP
jgi:hypothetical protein